MREEGFVVRKLAEEGGDGEGINLPLTAGLPVSVV